MGMESALTVKGQATIPKAVREYLHLKPGDQVKFFLHPNGTVVLLPKLPVKALRGILKSQRAVSLAEMDEAVAGRAGGPSKRRWSVSIPIFWSAISRRTIPFNHRLLTRLWRSG